MYLGINTQMKKRKQKECVEREICTLVSPVLHINNLYCHFTKEFPSTSGKLLSFQPVLVHVASIQSSHIFLTFSKHAISLVVQKKQQLVLSSHGIQQTSPGVC